MTGPYNRPPVPATEPTDVPAPLPEQMPGGDDTGPVMDPPINPDTPGLPVPSPMENPDTPGLPMPVPAM
ncbi:hypothetical protein [Deinococcus hopiensis]|uniref:Uncharacterized protein n=1 Tax=Deinococcus hopiensis KR-140 TaxID=695939 RepID=A0A1W1VEP3_9DEIO|nr:hypothetical protein [Deinococcus hopiensis]SMB91805.1 hypothetical protein SAMN00790413_01303 [Deinococcus hopiensis KR-140]